MTGSDDRTAGTSTTNNTIGNNGITSSSALSTVPPTSSSPSVDANEGILPQNTRTTTSTSSIEGEEEQSLELEAAASQAELGNSLQAQNQAVISPPPSFANSTGVTATSTSTSNNNNSNTASRSRNQSPNRQMTIQRRQSMPEMRIDPPLYQIDDDFNVQYREGQPIPSAREDEGIEELPNYTCDVHIEGYVPRKWNLLNLVFKLKIEDGKDNMLSFMVPV